MQTKAVSKKTIPAHMVIRKGVNAYAAKYMEPILAGQALLARSMGKTNFQAVLLLKVI